MCGIAGFNWPDQELIQQMMHSLRHRGPDDEGFYVDGEVSLGHRRLSILDTSSQGHQPMPYEHLVLVYNGEIYNFQELKKRLEEKGYRFFSHTDTEVILYSYHLWGPACVEKFNGMWAFCLYDRKAKTFFLSRDRFGIKPLYYYFDGEKFIFASELKAIREHTLNLPLNPTALNYYFYQKYIGGSNVIYNGCYKVQPSENITFELGLRKLVKSCYYHLEEDIAAHGETPLERRIESVEETIGEAVQSHLVADVPVGSFLSGGIDSSLISAIIARQRKDFQTFSIGFREPSFDEVPYSEMAARHIATRHRVEYLQMDDSLIDYLVSRMDEPFGDSSLLPTYLLSQITRQDVTVSLSGDGGDEIFGGYDSYRALQMARRIPGGLIRAVRPFVSLLPPSEKKLSWSFKIRKFVRDYHPNIIRRHLDWMSTFADSSRRELLGEWYIDSEEFLKAGTGKSLLHVQLQDIQNYLPEDILKKVDLASMLNSLEARVPFLDHRLVPLVLSLPDKYKIRYGKTKWLLKKAARPYLPPALINRPKRGFTVPVSRWIRESSLITDFLTNRRYYQHEMLAYEYVQRLLAEHRDQRQDHARPLWLIFVFNYWMYQHSHGGT